MTLLVIKTQAVTSFKEAYEECYRIFKEQVAQSDLSFGKRVQWIRDQLNIIIKQKDCEYSDIVCEYLSTRSKYIKNRDYVTSENSFISWEMWMKVWVIQQEYHHLDLRKNLSSLMNLMKFNYLESIESKTKN